MASSARSVGALVALALLGSACSTASPAASGPPGGAAPSGGAAAPQPAVTQPATAPAGSGPAAGSGRIDVVASPETEGRVTTVIGPDGGSLSTADSRGTKFELTFPEGALPGLVEISMTPIASIEGLPFTGSIVAGALLEPDGLRLQGVATLRVSGAAVSDDLDPIAFFGSGRDVHRWMLLPGDGVTIPVLHFSGSALVPDASDVDGWEPDDSTARPVHDAAESAEEARDRGDDAAELDAVQQAIETAYQAASATLPAALADPLGAGVTLTHTLLSLSRQLDLLGADGHDLQTLQAIRQILGATADVLARRCTSRSHDPTATFIRGIAVRRQAELLGLWDRDLSFRLEPVARCANYRIFVDPTIELEIETDHYVVPDDTVHATYVAGRQQVPLEKAGRWHGVYPLQVRSERWTDDCWTGRPFQLRGTDGTIGRATIDVSVEPTLVVVQPAADAVPATDATLLTATIRLDGYALMPVRDAAECMDEDFMLSDIGGAFLGGGGTVPFTVPVAGGSVERVSDGRALLRPPFTHDLVETADHASVAATYRFTSDLDDPTDASWIFKFTE